MEKTKYKTHKRAGRHARIRAKVNGSATRPRLAVFKSNTAIYAQLINDELGVTIAAADSRKEKGTLTDGAKVVGKNIAEAAKKVGITTVVYDRGGFKYQGVIAVLADSAREGGLAF
jgi:large subunit ribosomal protein L18